MFSGMGKEEDRKEIVVFLPSGFSARELGECYCLYWKYEERPAAMLPIEGITAEKIYRSIEVIKRQKGDGK